MPATAPSTGTRPYERLRRNGDVRRTLRARRPIRGRYVSVHVHDRGDSGPPRATVVAGRRVGSAVRRNRAKRRLRAALRLVELPPGRDVVLVARAGANEAPFSQIYAETAPAGAKGSGVRDG